MATLEKVIVKVFPMNEDSKPYVISFEHTAPNFVASKLAEDIFDLLKTEFIAAGAENIKYHG